MRALPATSIETAIKVGKAYRSPMAKSARLDRIINAANEPVVMQMQSFAVAEAVQPARIVDLAGLAKSVRDERMASSAGPALDEEEANGAV